MTDVRVEIETTAVPRMLVRIGGEIDIHTAPLLRADLAARLDGQPVGSRVVLDLSGVRFLAVAGARALAEAAWEAQLHGVTLLLGATSPQVDLVLRTAGSWDGVPVRERS